MITLTRILTLPIFVPLAIILNVLHPFLHAFEGGSFDAFIQYVNMMAFTEASR
jgi:hypothetical protein